MSYLALFGAVLATVFVPVPEEVVLLGAGYLARQGQLRLLPAFAVAWAAILLGDALTFLAGRKLLARLLRSRVGRRLLDPRWQARVLRLVEGRGARAVVVGRFLVALRGPVYLALGASRFPAGRFLALNALVGLLEVGLVVGAGYLFGHAPHLAGHLRAIDWAVASAVLLSVLLPPLARWLAGRAEA